MSLMTYDEARPWAKSIAKNVQSRAMPPWFAAPEFHGVFSNERTLDQAEIDTLVRWAENGAPAGASSGRAARAHVRRPPGLAHRRARPRRHRAALLRARRRRHPLRRPSRDAHAGPPAREPVHPGDRVARRRGRPSTTSWASPSCRAPATTTGAATAWARSRRARSRCASPRATPSSWSPARPSSSTCTTARRRGPAPASGTSRRWRSSSIPKDAAVRHFVDHNAIGNSGFELPPGAASWHVGAARVFTEPTTILGLHPHMHLRGKSATYTAYYPDGTTEVLLHVPDFDFSWQTDYSYPPAEADSGRHAARVRGVVRQLDGEPRQSGPEARGAAGTRDLGRDDARLHHLLEDGAGGAHGRRRAGRVLPEEPGGRALAGIE